MTYVNASTFNQNLVAPGVLEERAYPVLYACADDDNITSFGNGVANNFLSTSSQQVAVVVGKALAKVVEIVA